MNYRSFFIYNITGGFLWSVGLTGTGYYLGSVVPNVDRYLLPIIGLIVLLSILPSLIHILKNPTHRRQIVEFVKSKVKK